MFGNDLGNARVGDKVFIETTNAGFCIDEVTEITKAGNIKTAKNGIFTKDGTKRGSHDRFYRTHARLATLQDVDAVRRSKKLRYITKYSAWQSLSDADLDIVLDVLKKYNTK